VRQHSSSDNDLNLFFDLSLELLCIAGFDGYFKRINPSWSRILGWSDEELLSRPWIEFVHPDDVQKTLDAANQLNDGKALIEFENRYRCKDGAYRWISWKSQPEYNRNQIFAVARDITAEKQAAELRQAIFELFQQMGPLSVKELIGEILERCVALSSSTIGFFHRINPDQESIELVTWSRGTMSQCEVGELDSHYPVSMAGIWVDSLRQKQPLIFNDYSAAPGKRGLPEGHFPLIRFMTVPIMEEGSVVAILGVGNKESYYTPEDLDFAALYARNAWTLVQRKTAENDLLRAKDEAQAASRAKSAFIAGMSHEIRTPMNAIMGMAEALADSELNRDQRRYTGILRTAGEDLLNIINDILDISKIEAGKISLESSSFNLHELLKGCTDVLGYRAAQKDISLNLHVASGVPRTVSGDPFRLKQIIVNLLGNAIKFTDGGGVDLRVSPSTDIPGKVHLAFSVEDSGIGISPQQLERIFQPFEQADSSITRRFGGTGLGLSITRRLVDLMGGSINAESELGKGSRFFFDIPFAPGGDDEVIIGSGEFEASDKQSTTWCGDCTYRVLVAEDSQPNQVVLRVLLSQLPLEIDIAENGAEAVRRFQQRSYDLILMDIQMPVLDGLSAVKKIREIEMFNNRRRIPIVALSAHAMAEDHRLSREAGCDWHLNKPIVKRELVSVIEGFLSDHSPVSVRSKDIGNVPDGADGPIRVDPLIKPFVPAFLESCLELCIKLEAAINSWEIHAIREISHRLAGEGGTYGFDEISRLGREINKRAKSGDPAGIPHLIAELRRYIEIVEWE
jgi:PAS domain S-box-containing protein